MAAPTLRSDLHSLGNILGSPLRSPGSWLMSRSGSLGRLLLRPAVCLFKPHGNTVSPMVTTFCWACPRVRGGEAEGSIIWGPGTTGTKKGERRVVIVVVAVVVVVVAGLLLCSTVVHCSSPLLLVNSSSMKLKCCLSSPLGSVLLTCCPLGFPPGLVDPPPGCQRRCWVPPPPGCPALVFGGCLHSCL